MLNRKFLKFFLFLLMPAVFLLPVSHTFATESDPKVVAAAKKESGELLGYISLRLKTAKKLIDRFQAKYPFIKVDQYRADAERMMERALSEYRAGKHLIDVIQTSSMNLAPLKQEGVLGRYDSPQRKDIDPLFKDKEGYYTALYWYPVIIAYNTDLVSPAEVPKSWQDLLNPKWKGKITMPRDQVQWHRVMLSTLGEEKGAAYMKALAKQNVRITRGISQGMAMLAAGEFHVSVTRAQHAEIFKYGKGAPVDWVKDLYPMAMHGTPVSIMKKSPNPNSARLFIDFLLSEEGSEIIAKSRRIPARMNVKGLSPGFKQMNRKNLVPTPDEDIFKNFAKYRTQFRKLFGQPN